MPTNGRPVGRPYTENRVFARWSVKKLEQQSNMTLANYTALTLNPSLTHPLSASKDVGNV